MIETIQFKRGLEANLPRLADGEPAFCEDTQNVYIGSSSGNKLVFSGSLTDYLNKLGDLTQLQTTDKDTLVHAINDNVASLEFVTIGNLTVDGNKANQTQPFSGIYLYSSDRGAYTDTTYYNFIDAYLRMENVKILNCSGDGLYIYTRGESFFTNVHSLNNNGNGIFADTFDTFFLNVSSGQNTNSGFRLYSGNNRFFNCKAWNNGINNTALSDGYGFMITGANNHFYVECQGNLLDGFYLYSSNNNIITVDVDTSGQRDAVATTGVSAVKVVNAYQNIINFTCQNRPDRSETLILNAISLDNNSIRNKIRGTFEYVNTPISVDQGVMLKNDVSLSGRDSSSNPTSVVDTIGATSITAFSTFTGLPYGKVVAIGKDSFNASLLPASLTYGVVVISNGSQGGRITAKYSGLDSNSKVAIYEGVWNNSTGAMVWSRITAAEGTYTANGAGGTSLTIPHGLGVIPTYVHAQSGSVDAGTAQVNYVTADITNITVNFKNTIPTGTNNIVLYWRAKP
jgi:hypothetical protein